MDACAAPTDAGPPLVPTDGLTAAETCFFSRLDGLASYKPVDVLAPGELEALERLPFQQDRRREWLTGRLAAKRAVARLLWQLRGVHLPPVQIVIAAHAGGRPVVQLPSHLAACVPAISIAHTRGCTAAVAVDAAARVRVGIDVERIIAVEDNLERIVLTGAEQDWLCGLATNRRGSRFFCLWCAKEAAAKAVGRGLRGRPEDWTVVGCQDRGSHVRIEIRCPEGSGGSVIAVNAVTPDGALAAALAVLGGADTPATAAARVPCSGP